MHTPRPLSELMEEYEAELVARSDRELAIEQAIWNSLTPEEQAIALAQREAKAAAFAAELERAELEPDDEDDTDTDEEDDQ